MHSQGEEPIIEEDRRIVSQLIESCQIQITLACVIESGAQKKSGLMAEVSKNLPDGW